MPSARRFWSWGQGCVCHQCAVSLSKKSHPSALSFSVRSLFGLLLLFILFVLTAITLWLDLERGSVMMQELISPRQPPEWHRNLWVQWAAASRPCQGCPRAQLIPGFCPCCVWTFPSQEEPGSKVSILVSTRFWLLSSSLFCVYLLPGVLRGWAHPEHPAHRPGMSGLCISRAVHSAKYITCNNVPRIYSCLSGYILKCLMMCAWNVVISS